MIIQKDPLKRGFDIVFSLLALLIGAPLLILIALLVTLTSKGPTVYYSTRLGQGGKVIRCLKFRTMYQNAEQKLTELLESDPKISDEWAQYQKLKKDPRITPVGHFLRRTSLDEALQFWNVLKGDLSVVGPRPPTLMGPPDRYLEEIHSIYGERTEMILSVRPGITGIWQVSGRNQLTLTQKRQLEERYARTRSFTKDLLLIAKTIPAVLFSKGAY